MEKVNITIDRGQGKLENFQLPLIQETTSGFTCGNDASFGPPKTEWFPRNSKMIKSYIVEQ